ncbi:MAG: outer membrane protein assembly factor BamB [Burkholderiaceae bacterium]
MSRGLVALALTATALAFMLAGCSSAPQRPKPAELAPVTALIGVKLAWSNRLGPSAGPTDPGLQPAVVATQVVLASGDGTVAALDPRSGRDLWRTNVGAPLSAGVGSDGATSAVVTRGNDLVALREGKEAWRQRLSAQVITAPLVAGERVFVLAADRSVSAFDAASGRRLWTQSRRGEPLVLRQPGALLAVGDTLVAGLSSRMVGFNPNDGSVRWEAPIATPRGTNEVERLADVVQGVSRSGSTLCARAFQAGVGCIDANRGTVLWSQAANGATGLSGDDRAVFGVEGDGRIRAWERASGKPLWTSERLRWRQLSGPLALGRSVVVGDANGFVHLMSREDGSPLNRLTTDGSAVVATPVVAGQTLVVVTRSGGVFGFTPD